MKEVSFGFLGSVTLVLLVEWIPGYADGVEQDCWSQESKICVPSNSSTCFGSPFPYSFIPEDAELGLLESWTYLKRIPKCWSSLRPLLCSLYAPECSPITNKTLGVPKALCKALKGPCRALKQEYLPLSLQSQWDRAFMCRGKSFCEREIAGGTRDILKFPESHEGVCYKPLVRAQNPANYFKFIDGCGLQCFPPDKTPEQYGKIQSLIGIGVLAALSTSSFATATLILDWKSSSYPNRIIFYINLCGLLFISGWGLPFLQGDNSFVCNPDNTRRVQEPGEGQDLACVALFVLIYYFGLSSALWYAILTFSWNSLFSSMGLLSAMSQREILLKRTPYFHMIAWSVPAVLAIAIISLNGVEGDPLTGICFVSKSSPSFYFGFVIAPIAGICVISTFFVVSSVKSLVLAEKSAIEIAGISARSRRIRSTTVKIVIYSCIYFTCFFITVFSSVWIFSGYEEERNEAILKMYLGGEEFHKPLKYSEIVILPTFLSVIASASWVWNKNTFKSWRKFFRRRFNSSEERMKDIKVRKHELITQAFAKRKDLALEGRLSLTFESSRFDPVGVGNPSHFDDRGGVSSGDFSSTWAAALPRLVQRRGALVGGELINPQQQRRSSLDSEVSSVNRSRFSWMESRRQSFESQASSVPAFDMDRLQAIYDQAISSSKKRPKKRSKKRKLIFSSSSRPESRMSSRRNSIGSSSFVCAKESSSATVITLDPRKLMDTRHSSKRFISSPKEFFELKEKLKVLQTSSVDLDDSSKKMGNVTGTTTILSGGEEEEEGRERRTVSIQTSFTDLSGLTQVVHKSELGTQTTPPPGASDSSSQTIPHPIEPVVIQITDEHESSSFPSSAGGTGSGDGSGNQYELFLKEDKHEHRGPPLHNRGRRGAIIETSFKHLKDDLELYRLSSGVISRPLPASPLIDTSSTS
ncbi:protein smoothened [Lepeophtheirus salmonis]|uniref:Protein smoothenedlike [Apis florea] n=1 Tax=Lepeophtheirus salmonis TaxID=72036 RepID=A0A0K2ULM4_LEPSM|nr:smoothened homolog [Lepeophtheirus salmonis]